MLEKKAPLRIRPETIKSPREEKFQHALTKVAGFFRGVTADRIKRGTKNINDKRARVAALYYLTDPALRFASDEQISVYLNASEREIEDAIEAADTDVEEGTEFGKLLQKIRNGPDQMATATDLRRSEEPPIEERLAPAVNEVFLVGEKPYNIGQTSDKKLARWAVVFIARRCLHKDRKEAAALAGIAETSAPMTDQESSQEYAAQGSFYRKVRRVCKGLGIDAP